MSFVVYSQYSIEERRYCKTYYIAFAVYSDAPKPEKFHDASHWKSRECLRLAWTDLFGMRASQGLGHE